MRKNLTQAVIPHDIHWAIEQRAAMALWRMLEATDAVQHEAEFKAAGGGGRGETLYTIDKGIAIIGIAGPMTKSPTSLSGGVSTVFARRAIRAAASDEDVTGIVLVIDSPGGSVSGTGDFADDVAAAAKKKPVCAYVEDCCCSAAYWVASQAGEIYANATAMIGSIGVYMVVDDHSRRYENAGVKVHVISTGPYKGAGVEGAPISAEHLAEWQKSVDELNEHFIGAISKGREMARDTVAALADGRVHIASDAKKLGLIDGVASIDSVAAGMRRSGQRGAKADTTSGFVAIAEARDTHNINDLTNDAPPTGVTLEQALDSALIAVEEVMVRAGKVKAMRESQHRRFSQERLERLHALHAQLGTLNEECSALGNGEPVLATTDQDLKGELDMALLDGAVALGGA